MQAQGPYATYPSLRDRVVVVTGGASGIGEAAVKAFASNGSRVAILDVQVDAGQRLAASLAEAGMPAPLFLPCDLTDIAAARTALAAIIHELGRIDVLVNNAANDARHTIEEVTPEFWDQAIAVNLKHQFFMAQGVIPAMKKAGRGAIINMGSICWVIPSPNLFVYGTAKAAVVGLTRTLAHEVGACNIRVNCVMPGAVATERQMKLWHSPEQEARIFAGQALRYRIQPDDVARLVLFLASDDSAAITGQSHIIDAGWV